VRSLLFFILLSIGHIGYGQEEEKLPLRERLEEAGIEYQGYVSARQNYKVADDLYHDKKFNLSESRLQLDIDYYRDIAQGKWKSDLVLDPYLEEVRLDIREANMSLSPASWLDFKIGRQILTWGKGDLLFINDLFPKDFQSFFVGRELEYLKAPSDALKTNLYIKGFQLNIIYTPKFDPDIFPTGERLTFYDPTIGYRGEQNQLPYAQPDQWFRDDEYALRLKRNVKGFDLALYGYHGFWKSPAGFDISTGLYQFPSMSAIGFRGEGALLGGITSIEFGAYLSEDNDGTDPLINNSQLRWILGYARDFKNDWKASLQYYQEHITHYDALLASTPLSSIVPDQTQHTITLRLEKMLQQQKWRASLFTFYNVSAKDIYLRPNLSYKLTDAWKIDVGANVFAGVLDTTFWSQFSQSNNIYLGIKWSY